MCRQVDVDLLKSDSTQQLKMNRSGLIAHIAASNDVSVDEAERMYTAVINGICDVVSKGIRLSLQGFGAFYLQKHKGQPVRFSSTQSVARDYVVFKFSASSVLNQYLRQSGVVASK